MFEAQITETEPYTVAYLRMTGAYEQIPEAFGRLYHWIGKNGIHHVGPPHGVYITPPDIAETEAVWEIWAPIDPDAHETDPDESGVGVKRIAPMTVASTVHKGPYETLKSPYRELAAWMDREGYEPAGPVMELYLSDPDEVTPDEYLTEIRWPVRKV